MILQQTFVLEESPFGLTITDQEPLLWIERKGKRLLVFEGLESAAEFISDYDELMVQADLSDLGTSGEELFIQEGVENILQLRFNLRYKFDEYGFEEFSEHIVSQLIQFRTELKLAA